MQVIIVGISLVGEGSTKKHQCDVVVIGSGVSGLCAGALLADNGYSVVLVERLSLPGGRCSTKWVKGYRLDPGVQMLSPRGPLADICQQVGAKLELRFPQTLFSGVRVKGQDHAARGDGPEAWMELITECEENPGRIMMAIGRAVAWQGPPDNMTAEEWFRQYTHEVETLSRLQPFIAGTIGTNANECSAAELFRLFRISGQLAEPSEPIAGIPVRGALEPMQELVRAITDRGGQVWLNSPARRIKVSDGVAKGVIVERLEGMTELSAQAVVSCIPPRLILAMAGIENFDTGYLRTVREETVERSTPITHIYIGSDRPLLEQEGLVLTARTRRLFQLYSPTNTVPDIAPRGKHVTIAAGMPRPCIEPISPKRELELNLLDIIENLPGFDEHGEILMAPTYHRDWPLFGTWPGQGLPQRTPVVNLYIVGDRALPPGQVGVPGCARTAQIVVEDIVNRFKPGEAAPVF